MPLPNKVIQGFTNNARPVPDLLIIIGLNIFASFIVPVFLGIVINKYFINAPAFSGIHAIL